MLSVSKLIKAVKPMFSSRIAASIQIHTTSVNEAIKEENLGLPPRPRRPINPYIRYLIQMRPAFKKEHPDLSEINLVREIAKNYKTADPALIQKYEADYQKEREDFIKKLFLYESKLTAEQKQIIQDAKTAIADRKAKQVYKKRVREQNKPKRPPTGYLLYIMDTVDKIKRDPSKTYREHQKIVAETWRNLSEDKKKVYSDISKTEFEKYKQELTKWEHKMVRMGNVDMVRDETIIDKNPRKPRRRPNKPKASSDSDLD